MRFKIALIALLGGVTAGLGCCQHIGGKSDCGFNPADYPIGVPTTPYPTTPAARVPAPVEKIPEKIPDKPVEKKTDRGMPVDESGN